MICSIEAVMGYPQQSLELSDLSLFDLVDLASTSAFWEPLLVISSGAYREPL